MAQTNLSSRSTDQVSPLLLILVMIKADYVLSEHVLDRSYLTHRIRYWQTLSIQLRAPSFLDMVGLKLRRQFKPLLIAEKCAGSVVFH